MTEFSGFSKRVSLYIEALRVIEECKTELREELKSYLTYVGQRVAAKCSWFGHAWKWETRRYDLLWLYRKDWKPYKMHIEVALTPEQVEQKTCEIRVDAEGGSIDRKHMLSHFFPHELNTLVSMGYRERENSSRPFMKQLIGLPHLDAAHEATDMLVDEIAALWPVGFMLDRLIPPGKTVLYRSDVELTPESLEYHGDVGGLSMRSGDGRTGGKCIKVTNTAENFNDKRYGNIFRTRDLPVDTGGHVQFWVKTDSPVCIRLASGGAKAEDGAWVRDCVITPGELDIDVSDGRWVKVEAMLSRSGRSLRPGKPVEIDIRVDNRSGVTWLDGIEIAMYPADLRLKAFLRQKGLYSGPIRGPLGTESCSALQRHLRALGHYDSKIDGKCGPKTREAIRKLQKGFALPQTGDIDDDLVTALVTENR